MKKILIFFLVLLISGTSIAQKNEISMDGILKKAGGLVNLVEKEYGQEIVRMEFDLIKSSKQTLRYLSSNYTYGIIAFGDYRIKDIDIEIFEKTNSQWILINKDDDQNNVASVIVKPSNGAEYKIEITVNKFESGFENGHYGLIIYHK